MPPFRHKAWINHAGQIWHATDAASDSSGWTAVFGLINAIYELKEDQALRLLRQPLMTTACQTATIHKIVKLGAKRIRYEMPWVSSSDAIDVGCRLISDHSQRLQPAVGQTIQNPMEYCQALVDTIPASQHRYRSSRRVACIAVDRHHRLLGAAVNTNHRCRLQHAEANLAIRYSQSLERKLPSGCIIYTTLSPCQMCAEILRELSEDGYSLRVIASEIDRGSLGSNLALLRLEGSSSAFSAP